ncbi:leucine-rich repeats and immunoglobulin-like domains protein 1 [Brachyhypopomus gauderio]|uniref:leucine-rich repeats and immunoglobulin-like domains protein 1 n=1 Tax=Brachyhypopomus gauderio TaxID=698409 RepID=UPI004043805D
MPFFLSMLFLWTIDGKGIAGCKESRVKGQLHSSVELQGLLINSQDVETVSWTKYINESTKNLLYSLNMTYNSTRMGNRPNIYFNKENMSITLGNLTANDDATYEMETLFKNSTIIRCNITLTVLLPPVALRIAVSFTNSTLSLTCEVKGAFLLLRWKQNGLLMSTDQRLSFSVNNTSMQVSNLTSADCGVYTCQVSNEIGLTEAHVNIAGEHTTVCQSNGKLFKILLPTGGTLIAILLLCIVIICVFKYGPYRRNTSDRRTEHVYENPQGHLQDGAATSVMNPLPYVYTDFIKLRSFQQFAATGRQTEDSDYSTIAEEG